MNIIEPSTTANCSLALTRELKPSKRAPPPTPSSACLDIDFVVMALSKKSRKLAARHKEWVKSSSAEEDLEELVMDGVLPDAVIVRWCPAMIPKSK
jgi:hypothetical protein